MTTYTFSQLEDLWKQAGGNSIAAPMAAAIAMAESGGRSDAVGHPSNGTADRGLWQINSVHGALSTVDPLANARAAVSISHNGSDWRPWCTAWSSGLCSGTYLGSSAPFWKFLPTGSSTGSTSASVEQTAAEIQGAGISTQQVANPLNPNTWAKAILGPLGAWFFYGFLLMAGVFLTGLGVTLLLWETKPVQSAKNIVLGAVSFGAVKGKGSG